MILHLHYTVQGLDPSIPRQLRESLEPHFGEVSESPIDLAALESPTWVTLNADLVTWKAALAVPVAAFFKKLAERGAEHVWERRESIRHALHDMACSNLLAVSTSIREAQQSGGDQFSVILQFSFPDGFHGTRVSFRPADMEDAAWCVACFVRQAAAIHAFVEGHIPEGQASGPVELTLLEDGSFRIRWQLRDSSQHEEVLRQPC